MALRLFGFVLVFHSGTKFLAASKRFDGKNTARTGETSRCLAVGLALWMGLLVDASSCVDGGRVSETVGKAKAVLAAGRPW